MWAIMNDVLYTGDKGGVDAVIDREKVSVVILAIGSAENSQRLCRKNVPTSRREVIAVMLTETDGHDRVVIKE